MLRLECKARVPSARANNWEESRVERFLDENSRDESALPLSRRVVARIGDGGPGAAALQIGAAGDESGNAPHVGNASTAARAPGSESTPARSGRPTGEAAAEGEEANYTPGGNELQAERPTRRMTTPRGAHN